MKRAKVENNHKTNEALRILKKFFALDFFEFRYENLFHWTAVCRDEIELKFKKGYLYVSKGILQDYATIDISRPFVSITCNLWADIDLLHFISDISHTLDCSFAKFRKIMKQIANCMETDYVFTLKSTLFILGTWRNSDFSLLGKDVTKKICRIAMNR